MALFLCLAAAQAQNARPDAARTYQFETQELAVPEFAAEGWILDIGGGGEGVIGRMKPKQVVAIDLSRRELEDAPEGPLKLVMNATDLKFLDRSFSTATAFFTLMYVRPEADQQRIFREIFRVLRPGGRFLVWDVSLPVRPDPAKDIAVFRFLFKLPYGEVKTGYGTSFPEKPRGMDYYARLAEAAGFRVAAKKQTGVAFHMELRKPGRDTSLDAAR